ncbi:MAG: hypothetical protein LQ346_006735 [Caloplaca aetnensis]|nr:MAG: hypothetical protein LQ346_006735 [Caloplaca aetnensis]
MALPVAPNALETLLILRGIQTYGTGSPALDRLSQALKSSDVIPKTGRDYELFESKALSSLYIRLLKEEVKLESQNNDDSVCLQDGIRNSEERKLSSPPLETMEQAEGYSYLIPRLATKVYDQFRDSSIKAIEDEERRYRLLQQDIEEIERGEWDSRLQYQDSAPPRDSKGLSSIQTLLQHEPEIDGRSSPNLNGTSSSRLPSISQQPPSQQTPPGAPTSKNQPQPIPYANGDQNAAVANSSGAAPYEPLPTIVGSPRRAPEAAYTPHEPPFTTPKLPSQPGSADNGGPFFQNTQQGYRGSSPPSDMLRRQPSQPANIAPSPATRPHQTPLSPPERSSSSPIILPPPPGMLRSASSSSGPRDTLADMAGHQYRPGAVPSPRPSQASNGPQHSVQLPLPPNYAHRGYHYPPFENRTSYPSGYPPHHPGAMPPFHPHHHTHASPYHHPTHTPGRSPHYPPRAAWQPPVPTYPPYPPYGNAPPYTPPGPMASPYPPYPPQRPLNQQTPVSALNGKKRHPKLSPINTSVSSTKWKNTELPEGLTSPKSPIQPGADEISPISPKGLSSGFEPSATQNRDTTNITVTAASAAGKLPPPSDPPPKVKPRRGRPPRGSTTRGRGNRAPSTASSSFQARTRSASVFSGPDELSLDPPTLAANRTTIKPEPPATPARDSSPSIPPTVATDNEGNRKSTRRRRETLLGIESTAETTRTGTKRKRTATDASELDLPRTIIPTAFDIQKEKLSATHILASRNLPRTSATLINDISAHKLASIFAKPLTEREAPGYHSLIYRPQDLKSIKQAITNGNRALILMLESGNSDPDDPVISDIAGASESDMRFWVKKHEDIVPPKGIVNSMQLEREIMRVFANAVMFNPDPDRSFGPAFRTRAKVKERHIPVHLMDDHDDGEDANEKGKDDEDNKQEGEEGAVVRDTREMFEDVERMVAGWRAAEKAAEEAAAAKMKKMEKARSELDDDADDLAGEASADMGEEKSFKGRAGKRRRA